MADLLSLSLTADPRLAAIGVPMASLFGANCAAEDFRPETAALFESVYVPLITAAFL